MVFKSFLALQPSNAIRQRCVRLARFEQTRQFLARWFSSLTNRIPQTLPQQQRLSCETFLHTHITSRTACTVFYWTSRHTHTATHEHAHASLTCIASEGSCESMVAHMHHFSTYMTHPSGFTLVFNGLLSV